MHRHHADRFKDRSYFAFAQLENAGKSRLLGIVQRNGYLIFKKRPRTDSTGGDDQHNVGCVRILRGNSIV